MGPDKFYKLIPELGKYIVCEMNDIKKGDIFYVEYARTKSPLLHADEDAHAVLEGVTGSPAWGCSMHIVGEAP